MYRGLAAMMKIIYSLVRIINIPVLLTDPLSPSWEKGKILSRCSQNAPDRDHWSK